LGAVHGQIGRSDVSGAGTDATDSGHVVAFDTLLVVDEPGAKEAFVRINDQRLTYPFVFAVVWEDERQRRGKMYVNGVAAQLHPKVEMPDYPKRDTAKMDTLFRAMGDLQDRLYELGLSQRERAEAVADTLRRVAWIDSVEMYATEVIIYPRPEVNLPAHGLQVYPRGSEPRCGGPPPGPPDFRGNYMRQAARFAEVLRRGGFVIMHDVGWPMTGDVVRDGED